MEPITKMKDMDTTLLMMELMKKVAGTATRQERNQVVDALMISSTLHIDDFRRSPRSDIAHPPYMEHVLRVALRPVKYFNVDDINVIIAGLLHDTVEDHALDFFPGEELDEDTAREEMLDVFAEQFSTDIAESVELLTNPIIKPGTPKKVKQDIYRDHVVHATSQDQTALIVKVSDFIDNAGSLHITHATAKNAPSTRHLVSKYTPLLDYFLTAVSETLPEDQALPMVDRLARVESGLESLG